MKKAFTYIVISALLCITAIVLIFQLGTKESKDVLFPMSEKYEGKKIFYVNSYHKGYSWSDRIEESIVMLLDGKEGVELKVAYLDSKNHPEQEDIDRESEKIIKEINEYNPDVLIVSDDNAYKNIVMPYFKDSNEMPVVFCGINYNLDTYGGAYSNTTGMIEVSPYKGMIEIIEPYINGKNIGFLTGDFISEHKNFEMLVNEIPEGFTTSKRMVKKVDEWKRAFLELQEEADVLIMGVAAGIEGWDHDEIKEWMMENISIPTITEAGWLSDITMFTFAKMPGEQGEYAATATLRILDGASPRDIPIVKNQKGGLMINNKIVNLLGITIAPDLIEKSIIIE